jgi:hypothetical protein
VANRICFWCGEVGLTREHLVPRWLSNELVELFPWPEGYRFGYMFTTKHGASDLRLHPGQADALPQLVVRKVCAACNNGWMARLEHDARPLVSNLISGGSRRLAADDQLLLARWSSKTAALLDAYSKYTLVFGDTDLDQIRLDGHAPMSWHIRLAYRSEMQPQPVVIYITSHRADPVGTGIDLDHDAIEPNAFSVTFGFGRLAIAVVGGPGVDNPARWVRGGDFPLMVWPPSARGLAWPPSAPRLNGDAELMAFHESFWSETLNPDFATPDVLGRMAESEDPGDGTASAGSDS